METIVVSGENKSSMKLLLALAVKLGLTGRSVTGTEAEDLNLALMVKAGMTGEDVSREEVMKALGK